MVAFLNMASMQIGVVGGEAFGLSGRRQGVIRRDKHERFQCGSDQ